MTININLLPRPKRRIRQVPVIFLTGILVFLAGSVFMYREYHSAIIAKEATEQMLLQVKSRKEKLQQQLIEANQQIAAKPDTATFIQLPEVVKSASVDTNFMFDQVAALLPIGSVVTSLEFTHPNQIKVNTSFSTIEEAVGFMQAARKSPYFRLDKVSSVGKSKLEVGLESMKPEEKPNFYLLSFELSVKRNTLLP